MVSNKEYFICSTREAIDLVYFLVALLFLMPRAGRALPLDGISATAI